MGIGRGLDPADRPAPLRQRPPCRHQRDPRRTRRGRHHQHPARQPHRHPPRPPPSRRPGRGVRPATPGRGHPCRAALVTGTRLPRPTDRDDPRQRPRRRYRPLRWWGGVRRLLGGQDPHRASELAARRSPRRQTTRRTVQMDPRPLGCLRSGRNPQLPPERGDGLGRLPGRDDRRRPQDPRQHLARRLPRPRRACRPSRARRGVT